LFEGVVGGRYLEVELGSRCKKDVGKRVMAKRKGKVQHLKKVNVNLKVLARV
jgi:hypothetical protein